MQFNINVDCTPSEAREFLGLPDVKEMHAAVLSELQARMMSGVQNTDPAELLKMWMPDPLKGFEQFQNIFGTMTGMRGTGSSER